MADILQKSRRFWNLPGRNKSMFLRACWVLTIAHVRLRFQSYPQTLEWASQVNSRHRAGDPIEKAVWIRDVVEMAARNHLLEMSCLRQALAIARLLSKEGVPSTLKLGARQREGQLEAHAWLEVESQTLPVMGAADQEFEEMGGKD